MCVWVGGGRWDNYLEIDERFHTQKRTEITEAGRYGTANASILQWEEFTNQKWWNRWNAFWRKKKTRNDELGLNASLN